MPFAFLLAVAALCGGTLTTYFYDRDAPFAARLCAGTATGFAALGLVGFILASFFGLTPLTLVVSALITASPLALLLQREWREQAARDASEMWRRVRGEKGRDRKRGMLVFYAGVALLFWLLFGRVMYVRGGEVFTGVETNLGDLPFHISIITGFAFGDNFPPQHTEFAGVRLTYPFLVDFVAAMFVRAGASLRGALFWENFVLALALVGLLHRWAWKLTREHAAAMLVPVITLLSGGLGWWMLVEEWGSTGRSLYLLLTGMTHDYTITSDGLYRWGNALTVLLIPQRGLLLGLPLALVVWTLWWHVVSGEEDGEDGAETRRQEESAQKHADAGRERRGDAATHRGGEKNKKSGKARRSERGVAGRLYVGASRPPRVSASPFYPLPRCFSAPVRVMAGAGVVAGLLPLVHAHSFVVMMGMGGCLALLFPKWWRAWAVFFVVAMLVAAPQMYWATRESGARAGTFFGWEFGWDRGKQNVVLFWLRNTGLFIPLLVAALAWRGERPVVSGRLLRFFLPFTLCFVVPNLYKLSPWVWDNIKVIFYWWVASAPLVALVLVRLWRERSVMWKAAAVVALVVLTAAGALDVWRVVSEGAEQRIFDRDGVALSELIKRQTPPRSLILRAPTYNHPVYLTGRRSVMGYAGHLWTHGLDYLPRQNDLRRIYAGGPEAEALIRRYGIDYVVVGRAEQAEMPVNSQFFERYTKVGEAGGYRLYRTTQP